MFEIMTLQPLFPGANEVDQVIDIDYNELKSAQKCKLWILDDPQRSFPNDLST